VDNDGGWGLVTNNTTSFCSLNSLNWPNKWKKGGAEGLIKKHDDVTQSEKGPTCFQ
jgi:hypothetical protein